MNLLIIFWCVLAGGMGLLTVPALNRIPSFWLCEWGQEPELCRRGKRMSFWPWSPVCSMVLISVAVQLCRNQQKLWPDNGRLSAVYPLLGLLFLWLLLQTSLLDRRFLILTDQHTFAIFLIGLAFFFLDLFQLYGSGGSGSMSFMGLPYSFPHRGAALFHESWTSPLSGALLCSGPALVISLAGERISGQSCLGFGDVKLYAALGFAFGQAGGIFVLFCSFFLCGAVMGILLLLRFVKLTDHRAMGPYIAVSAALWLLFGEKFKFF